MATIESAEKDRKKIFIELEKYKEGEAQMEKKVLKIEKEKKESQKLHQ